jgi:hypothetical protein
MRKAIVSFVRDAEWFNRDRARGYSAILGILSLGHVVYSWFEAQKAPGSDFLAFWGAAKAVTSRVPDLAYDLAWQDNIQQLAVPGEFFAFVNPPPFLFVVAPLGFFNFSLSWILWVAVSYSLWSWIGVKAFPHMWPLVLSFPGALIAAVHAQNGFVTGALLLGGVFWLDRRPFIAGALLGALVIKPHLALLVPIWLAAGGRWKAFAAASASSTFLVASSWLVFGTATMVAYTQSWPISAQIISNANEALLLRMATPYAQVRLFAGESVAIIASSLLALSMLVLVMRSWRRFGQDSMATGAFMLAATVCASPYLFNYDLPLLVLPVLWLACEGLRTGFKPWEKLVLVGLWIAPYATRAVALPLGLNLMPVAAGTLAWLIWLRANERQGA